MDFVGAELHGLDFRGEDLRGFNFSRADLTGSDFRKANAPRTDFAAFVLDLLDFIEEKIVEAMETETSRVAAVGEAAGVLPLLRDRLRENEVVQGNFILLLDVTFEERYAAE
jgi:hypothetical protein